MSEYIIKAENLSKSYMIRHQPRQRGHYTALRDVLADGVKNIGRHLIGHTNGHNPTKEIFWALKDVSFEIKRGERLGIIGRNGAGKSTLLKILSRITEPTEGRVRIRGRVASLLEVGTGFHPELTGRENIYLNGAILGMTHAEIKHKFDEIVAFAEVEKFLDTPVKRYSSGMYVRLAFAVAAHLEPEILVVDEVLAVGDVAFQKKCLGKMSEVAKAGRTVLFVSHNMGAIRNLCERGLLLKDGKLLVDSSAEYAITRYLDQHLVTGAVVSAAELEAQMEGVIRWENPYIRLQEIALLDQSGQTRTTFNSDEEIEVNVIFKCLQPARELRVVIYIVDENNVPILAAQNVDDPQIVAHFGHLDPGIFKATCTLPANIFGARQFFLTVQLIYPHIEHLVVNKILKFEVVFKGYNNVQYFNFGNVFIRPQLNWKIENNT